MPKAATRAQNVQIPGAESTQAAGESTDETQAAGTDAGVTEGAEDTLGNQALPPDIAALVQMEVAKVLARQQASRAEPQAAAAELPTQAEALAQCNSDPKRRSVLSKEGWVVTSKPLTQGRDENGFAKA